MTNHTELVRVARTWLDVPFKHQGRSRQGVDCGGLLVCVGEEAGLTVIHPEVYSMSPDPSIIAEALSANCDKIDIKDAQSGDVLWLSFAGEPRHVGIKTDIGLLHAWAKPGKVVEHRIDDTWRRRIVSAWRLR